MISFFHFPPPNIQYDELLNSCNEEEGEPATKFSFFMIRNPYKDFKKVALAVFLTWRAWIMVTHQCLITSLWMMLLSRFYNLYLVALEMYENIHASICYVRTLHSTLTSVYVS